MKELKTDGTLAPRRHSRQSDTTRPGPPRALDPQHILILIGDARGSRGPLHSSINSVTFAWAEYLWGHDRRAGICGEKWRAPVGTIDASAHYHGYQPQYSYGHGDWVRVNGPFGALRKTPHPHGSEGIIQRPVGIVQAGMYQTNERDTKISQRVPDGRVAAFGVPAQEPFLCEAHASENFLPRGERYVCRQCLDNIRSTLGVQYVGCSA